MSKMMLALGSFIVGACSAAIVLGIQTSTVAHAEVEGMRLEAAIPVVPNIPLFQLGRVGIMGFDRQQLDGFAWSGGEVTVKTLMYSGGNFAFNGTKVRALRLEFKGPALNTFKLLTALGAFRRPEPTVPEIFSPPKLLETSADSATILIAPKTSPATITLATLNQ